jgi:hypothetical protein
MRQSEISSSELWMMVHMCYFVGEVLGAAVLLVLGVLSALVAVVTGHNNIYFLFLLVFFCFLYLTW